MPDEDGREPADLFVQTWRDFHHVLGRLSVIQGAVRQARGETEASLSETQRAALHRIDSTSDDLAAQLTALKDHLLNALAAWPEHSSIHQCACLHGDTIGVAELHATLAEIRATVPLHSAILIAEGPAAPALRDALEAAECTVRAGTSSIDLPFFWDAAPTDAIFMVAPPDRAGAWWIIARTLLSDRHVTPVLVNLVEAE